MRGKESTMAVNPSRFQASGMTKSHFFLNVCHTDTITHISSAESNEVNSTQHRNLQNEAPRAPGSASGSKSKGVVVFLPKLVGRKDCRAVQNVAYAREIAKASASFRGTQSTFYLSLHRLKKNATLIGKLALS